jgi:hypothetical protein
MADLKAPPPGAKGIGGHSLVSASPTLQPPAQSSMPQNTAVGSGSRPGKGKTMTQTSAPSNPRTLGRS